jgi:hypothetical protein
MSLINRVGMLGRANLNAAREAVSQSFTPGAGRAVAWDLEFGAREALRNGVEGVKRALGKDPDWLRHLDDLDKAARAPGMGADNFDWSKFAQEVRRDRAGTAAQGAQAMDPKLRAAYQTLGVAEGASLLDVRAAWKAAAKKWHPDGQPDKAVAHRRMQDINAAWSLINSMQGDG